MKNLCLLITLCTTLVVYTPRVHAQYKYIGDYTEAECSRYPGPSIYRGYACGGGTTCDTNITFRSQSPYNTLSDIASLLGADATTVSHNNPNYDSNGGNVGWNQVVYVPITCDCPNGWLVYRKKVVYMIGYNVPWYDVANDTFQGLTTCQILREQNGNTVPGGSNVSVPLRCACPTPSQSENGIKSLTTYVVGNGETIPSISTRLKVDSKSIYEANDLQEDSTIYPFTTLLIPVMDNDKSTSLPPSPSASQPPQAEAKASSTLSKGAIAGIAAGGSALLLAFGGGVSYKFKLCGSVFSCFNTYVNNKKEEQKNNPMSQESNMAKE